MISSDEQPSHLISLSLPSGVLPLKMSKNTQCFLQCYCYIIFGIIIFYGPYVFLHQLTIIHCPAVLAALRFAVELVGVALAEACFVGNAQTNTGVKCPDGGLSCAGLGRHRQTAHSWGDTTYFHEFKEFCFLFSQQTHETEKTLKLHLYINNSIIFPHGKQMCPLFVLLSIPFLTLSATPLQTLPLVFKVVLVAQTASVLEELTAHCGGVVVVTLEQPETRSCIRCCFTGL